MRESGKIYTKAGDQGRSSTLDGIRRPKSDTRFRSLGTLDELNASLGLVAADPTLAASIRNDILRVQRCLFEAGTALASNDPATSSEHFREETGWLEQWIDSMQAELSPLTRFILPGGSSAGAALHLSRTICRRAETAVVEYCADEAADGAAAGATDGAATGAADAAAAGATDGAAARAAARATAEAPGVSKEGSGAAAEPTLCLAGRIPLLAWLNRLSDTLFVLARFVNHRNGVEEAVWESSAFKRKAQSTED